MELARCKQCPEPVHPMRVTGTTSAYSDEDFVLCVETLVAAPYQKLQPR